MRSEYNPIDVKAILTEFFVPDAHRDLIISTVHDLSLIDQIIALYLHGSYARKESKPYSDIDIAAITAMPDPPRDLREIIGSYSSEKIDVQVFSDLPLPALMEVLNQGIPLFIRSRETLWNVTRSVSLSYMDLEPMRNRWKKRILEV